MAADIYRSRHRRNSPHYIKLTGNNTIGLHLPLAEGIHLLSEYSVYGTVRPIWLACDVGRATNFKFNVFEPSPRLGLAALAARPSPRQHHMGRV